MDVEFVSQVPAPPDAPWPSGWRSVLSHTHTFSGRTDHGGWVGPPESYVRLSEWAARLRVDALGMGSPYTPRSAATYMLYDGPQCERYYSGAVDPQSVLDQDEIDRMLAEVNAVPGGRTLFYLDNETPKGRYGHMWWLGYRQIVPAWHDYDQPFDRWMLSEAKEGDSSDEPMPYARRPYLAILAEQRSHGALGIWAHPASWWLGDARQFVTNIATEMPAHAIAEGRLDGLVIMGYQAYRPEYLALWFALLNRGLRVPGVAEMDCSLSDPRTWARQGALLTYAWAPGEPVGSDALREALKAGRVFASSGPFIDLSVDGHPMGDVAATARDRVHTVVLTVRPRPGGAPLDRVDVVGPGGEVVWSCQGFPGGTILLRMPGLPEPGYLVACAQASDRGCTEWRQPSQVAVGNPVYLHPPGTGFQAPATTRLELTVRDGSPFAGGELRFEAMDGQLLGRAAAAPGGLHETLPATGRITLVAEDGRRRTDYLLNVNGALQAAQRHLYRGRFRLDFPEAPPGQVPVPAWRLDDFASALREVRCTY